MYICTYMYVCAHFRNAIFRQPVGRPHGSIPTHFSCALSLSFFSLSLSLSLSFSPRSLRSQPFFAPPSFLPFRSPSPIFISLAFIVGPVPSFLASLRRPNPDKRNSHEALAHWERVVGRLFGNINEPTVSKCENARLLPTFFFLLVTSLKQSEKLLLFCLFFPFFTNEFAFESFRPLSLYIHRAIYHSTSYFETFFRAYNRRLKLLSQRN